jgi:predicted metal-dependent RNase
MKLLTALDGLYIHGIYELPAVSDCNSYDMGLCKIEDTEIGMVTVYVRRPGLLFGKGGKNLKAVEDYCGFKVKVIEYNPFM